MYTVISVAEKYIRVLRSCFAVGGSRFAVCSHLCLVRGLRFLIRGSVMYLSATVVLIGRAGASSCNRRAIFILATAGIVASRAAHVDWASGSEPT